MSTAITPVKSLMNSIESGQAELAKVLPKHLSVERFVYQVKMALMKNTDLQACSPASVFDSVKQAADLGLDCSGSLGSAYLVPYNGVCTLIPGYRGLIDLACRSGFVKSANAWVIHERDAWKPARAGFVPHHVPYFPLPDQEQSPGRVLGAWARMKLSNGGDECEVMTLRELDAIRARSRAKKGPWLTDPEEMMRKTVLRRLLKKAPLSPGLNSTAHIEAQMRFQRAVDLDDAEYVNGGEMPDDSAPKKSKTEEMKQKVSTANAEMSEEEKAEAVRRENEQAAKENGT